MFPHGDTDTTNPIERHWELIKYTTFNGRANHRLDVLTDALVGNQNDGTFHGGPSEVGFYMEKQKEVDLGLHTTRATTAERNRQAMAEMYIQAYSKNSSVLRLQNGSLLLFKVKSSSRKGKRYNRQLSQCHRLQTYMRMSAIEVQKFKPHLLANIAPPDARNPTILAASNIGSSAGDTGDETADSVPTPESPDADHW
ncbi:hypothetical protein Bbelb_393920 [Branchiostoma belcheri]|nr:hypothetical protein Bbelb_393920 [Branchiostoma belcheri]